MKEGRGRGTRALLLVRMDPPVVYISYSIIRHARGKLAPQYIDL
jgi:hypothetical protein